ncbi:MAG TPA: saccharopine dehydrogenase NADP-binding domain-containing protein [Polyangiaceae bacterium]
MHRVLVLGGGKIGRMIACLLAPTGDYTVTVGDNDEAKLELLRQRVPGAHPLRVDVTDRPALARAIGDSDAVISALSYAWNPTVAELCAEAQKSYFDLTEDRETTRRVREIATRSRSDLVFMPQCGLAPGFVSVVANELTKSFDRLDKVFMRVGALPQFPSNFLKYNLTWSTDGLINEYCNPCEAIHEGVRRDMLPLEGLEHFSLDGVRYEAFNTSGGLGSLCETFDGRLRELNYKTIRYLGHRDYMAFLLHELRMSEQRPLLKRILEEAIPVTFQDVVVVFCTVSGWRAGQLVQMSDARKIYNATVHGQNWSAIQITTAAGVCVMVDLYFSGALGATGVVRQEQVGLEAFLGNRFGQHYRSGTSSLFSLATSDFSGELR